MFTSFQDTREQAIWLGEVEKGEKIREEEDRKCGENNCVIKRRNMRE